MAPGKRGRKGRKPAEALHKREALAGECKGLSFVRAVVLEDQELAAALVQALLVEPAVWIILVYQPFRFPLFHL